MKIKELPYWVKGAIVGLSIGLIVELILLGLLPIFRAKLNFDIDVLYLIVLLPTMLILDAANLCRGEFCNASSMWTMINAFLVQFFIAGIIIGWLIGKIKKRTNNDI
jgi:hypothetical protein